MQVRNQASTGGHLQIYNTNMNKRPKRDLQVKSIFEGETNHQSVVTPPVYQPPAQIAQQQPTKQPPIIQFIPHHAQSPLPQNQIPSPGHSQENQQPTLPAVESKPIVEQQLKKPAQFPTVPKSELPKQETTQPLDSKKSKIEELKQKYLKKNPNAGQQASNKTQIRGCIQQSQKQQPVQPQIVHHQTPQTSVPVRVQIPTSKPASSPQAVHIEPIDEQTAYNTDFKQIIQEKHKQRVPPPPPGKRQIGLVKDPFQLKGTYPNPLKKPVQSQSSFSEKADQNSIPTNEHSIPPLNTPPPPNNTPFDPFIPSQTPSLTNSTPSLNYSNLIKNPEELIRQLHNNGLIPEAVYQLSLQRLFDRPQSTSQIEVASNHPQFNQWVSGLFTNLIIKSPVIEESNFTLADDILNEFFLPLGNQFSPAFVVTLAKLNHQYYTKYQSHLLMNPLLYVQMIATYKDRISKSKAAEFLNFIQNQLDEQRQDYCRILVTMFLISPQTVNEQALNRFAHHCTFEEAVILSLILGKIKPKFTKQNVQIANIVIKRLEENKHIETGLELVRQLCNQLGAPAYSLLKQTRQRLIKEFDEPQKPSDTINQAKNVASNLFGFFSNAMDKIINKQQQPETPPPRQQKPSQPKQSIYFDPVKKRYVLNGEIPDDEQETVAPAQREPIPPPPQIKTLPPPPPAPPSNANQAKRQNRMPANRYV